jgi:hypothetical protein
VKHVATASSYHFALRKIIESVACGCTPVTNLPAYDVLPEIDPVLVRIDDDATEAQIGEAIAFLLVVCCIAVPLGIWKLLDIVLWVSHHVSFSVN